MYTMNRVTILFLSAITLLTAFTSANPLPRAIPIPPVPADPPKPADGDGIGPYASQNPGISDRLSKAKFYTVAVAAGELGLTNAERGMRHYLGNSGDDLNVTPESMMSGLPQLRTAVKALAQNEAVAAYKKISGASGEKAFSSSWNNFYASKDQSWDWYFAIGGFSYSVTGVVTKKSGGGSLKYRVHIFDRYNWDAGKSVDIGPFHFEDRELGNLHLKGLAREYTVRGSGGVNEVEKFTLTTVIPPPSTGGRS
ncbi:hypothetical protein GJ744_009594 [Endocarpon pusillum]|uniref:Uncharacterized protein n=1 Tax=Endocarpon pusillum TaxID=364733 RepID=A0A8H7E4T3_9EURO|nr:hypothetical protein GJ744_009594 [Endocarpon pusillum]